MWGRNMVNREVENKLLELLNRFSNTENLEFWEQFYDFVILSYNFKDRYGMTGLSEVLNKTNIKNKKEILEFYGRGLFLLARLNNLEIYGDGFCV